MRNDSTQRLEHALRSGQVEFVFQPVADLRSGDVIYAEALARWNDPEQGTIRPADFLPLVTTTALADLLTECTLQGALDALPVLRGRYGTQVRIGVNLSNLQLRGRAAELVVDAARTSDGDSEWLTIELVEDLVIDDRGALTSAVDTCRASGARVMLDDFGTGTATLSLLTDLGYDGVKLDRRYVSAITTSMPARLLVESLVRFGYGANVGVIAEGIEDAETANELRGMHCRYGQGFHIARPMTVAQLNTDATRASRQRSSGSYPSAEQATAIERAHDAALAARVRTCLRETEPTTTALGYDTLTETLAKLEDEAAATAVASDRTDLIIEVRDRQVLSALYFNRIDEVIERGLALADFCEQEGRIAAQANALGLVASTAPADNQRRNIATDALVRLLQLRNNESLDLAALTRLDNNIGAIFAHIGLREEAFTWWLHSFRRAGDLQVRAVHLTRLNLIEHILARHEVSRFGYSSFADQFANDVDLLDELLGLANPITDLGPGMHASYACRRHLLAGDIEAAHEALDDYCDLPRSGLIVQYGILRAGAVLARAENNPETFLKRTTEMVNARPERGVMLLHQRATDRLHAEALASNGRFEEAFEFMREVLEHEARESSAATGAVYGWLQSEVTSERPFLPRMVTGPSLPPQSAN